MHINGYQLVEFDDYQKFVLQVNSLLGEGWELHGATQVIQSSYKNEYQIEIGITTYYQAMILLKKESNP